MLVFSVLKHCHSSESSCVQAAQGFLDVAPHMVSKTIRTHCQKQRPLATLESLKRSVAEDRQAYVAKVASEVSSAVDSADSKEVRAKIRQLEPNTRPKFTATPYLAIQCPNCELAVDAL